MHIRGIHNCIHIGTRIQIGTHNPNHDFPCIGNAYDLASPAWGVLNQYLLEDEEVERE